MIVHAKNSHFLNKSRSMISRQFIYVRNKVYLLLKLEKNLSPSVQMGELIREVSDLPSQVAGWIINAF